MHIGPNIERDGLVFGYDTGYGITDNYTATRFYPGQPTTNIVPLSLSNSLWFNEYSSGRILQSETLFDQPAYEFKSNPGQIWVSPFAFNNYDRSTNDLTLSVYAKNIGSSAASMNTYLGGDYSSDSLGNGNTKSLPADNTWRRYSWTRFSAAMVANYLEFRTANTGVVISCPQLEIGRIVTPTVNGTRSSTQSLIDLNRTTTIDVSNVSFDSTGQPTFDGTDDRITLYPGAGPGISQSFTVNAWVNCANVAGSNNIVSKNGPYFMRIVSSRVRFNVLTSTGWLFQNGTTLLSNNTWYNFHMVYDGATWKGYINGEIEFNTPKTGTISSNAPVYIGYTLAGGEQAGFNGLIPVVKIYNRALAAEEVQQNFKAYKNRFDI